jgi:hypothetical protein
LPERLHLAENYAGYDWLIQKMVQRGSWKMIYSLLDGKRELYRLPDEHTERSHQEPAILQELDALVHDWMEEDDFWLVHVHGGGDFSVKVSPEKGQCTHVFPLGEFDAGRGRDVVTGPSGRWLGWRVSQEKGTRTLYFRVLPAESTLEIDANMGGTRAADKVFLGPERMHPDGLPCKFSAAGRVASPYVDRTFAPGSDGVYLVHHRGKKSRKASAVALPLDEELSKQLKGLNYLR